jgi:hypothetical protein
MSLRWSESADHLNTAQLARKWDLVTGSVSVTAAAGRNFTSGLRFGNWQSRVTKLLDAQDTWIVGFALRLSALPAGDRRIMALADSTPVIQVEVVVTAAGAIKVNRGIATAVLGTSAAGVIVPSTTNFQYVEMKIVIGNTGSIDVDVDEVSVLAVGSADTMAGEATAQYVQVLGDDLNSDSCTVDIDDLYVCDGEGADNNDILGNRQVEARLPDAEGAHAQWSVSGAAANWQAVDETPGDDDTTYVASNTDGQKDAHEVRNTQLSTGTPNGVVVHLLARREEDNAKSIKNLIRVGATDYVHSTAHLVDSETYRYYSRVYETSPATGVGWTLAGINAAQYGYQFVAGPPILPEYLWYKADNVLGTGDEGLVGGSTQPFWYDSSENGRHATNTVGPDNPTYLAAGTGLNGLPGMSFNADKLLFQWSEGGPLNLSLPNWSFYFVIEVAGTHLFQGAIIQSDQGASVEGLAFGLHEDFGAYKWWLAKRTNGLVTSNKVSANQGTPPYSAALISGNSDLELYVDGAALGLSAGGPSISSARGLNPESHTNIKLYEVMVYITRHNTTQRQSIEAYLNTKWGL